MSSNSWVSAKSNWFNGLNCAYCTCFFTSSGAFEHLLWSFYGQTKCDLKQINYKLFLQQRTKHGLFGINKEFQFWVWPCTSLYRQRKENVSRGEKEVGKTTVNCESRIFHYWVLARKEEESWCFLLGLASISENENSPYWSLNSI